MLLDEFRPEFLKQLIHVDELFFVLAPDRVNHDADVPRPGPSNARLHFTLHHPLFDVANVWYNCAHGPFVEKCGDKGPRGLEDCLQNGGNRARKVVHCKLAHHQVKLRIPLCELEVVLRRP